MMTMLLVVGGFGPDNGTIFSMIIVSKECNNKIWCCPTTLQFRKRTQKGSVIMDNFTSGNNGYKMLKNFGCGS